MRVLTWNVHRCRGGIDAVAGVIAESGADAACLQEVGRGQERALGALLGMRAVKGATLRLQGFGNAVLVRERPAWTKIGRLSRSPGFERRGFAIAAIAGTILASVHLGPDASEHERHARELLRVFDGLPGGSLVVGVDLNEQPGGPAGRLLTARLRDCAASGPAEYTYPSESPHIRIDYVLADPGLRVAWWRTISTGASDHRPVVVELRP